jgi:hypothetical protein
MFTSKTKRMMNSARNRPGAEDKAPWMQQPISSNSSWVPVAPPTIDTGATATSTTKFRIEPVNPSPRDTASKSRSRNGSRETRLAEVPRPESIAARSRTVSTGTSTSVESESKRAAPPPVPKPTRRPLLHPRPERGSQEKPREESKGRGRSKSRGRSATPTTPKRGRSDSKNQKERSLSKSRGMSIERRTRGASVDSKTRGESIERSTRGASVDPKSRGASVERKARGASIERNKARDRTRPPITRNGREGRARDRSQSSSTRDGRPRARSRSASLTRVTHPGHAPPSPSVKSVKSVGRAMERPPNPPSTIRTRGELRRTGEAAPRAARAGVLVDEGSLDARIGRDISFGKHASGNASITSLDRRKRNGIIEKLFGDHVQKTRGGLSIDQVRPRILLAATVYHNTATNLWITTINTNQRGVAKNPSLANKYLKAFSFPSEHEARESAIANAPPKMVSFNDVPNCFICNGSFAVFRRASHCRNCGVCICKECSVQWPSKMLPDTYNLKHEASNRVCRSCNALSRAFRVALIEGNYEEAIALYGTGNINLRTPFPVVTKKEEIMYPIHCAVEGGNIDIVRWLVDGHFCPIKKVQAGGAKKVRRGAPESLITTSRSRHVLSIAMQRLSVDMIRYLVVDCGVSIHESADLDSALRALEAALMRLPRITDVPRPSEGGVAPRWDNASFDALSVSSSLSGRSLETGTIGSKSRKTNGESCIICFDRKIECVCTPCGHQMCCLECSSNLKVCPVCNARGNFIKIFRP